LHGHLTVSRRKTGFTELTGLKQNPENLVNPVQIEKAGTERFIPAVFYFNVTARNVRDVSAP